MQVPDAQLIKKHHVSPTCSPAAQHCTKYPSSQCFGSMSGLAKAAQFVWGIFIKIAEEKGYTQVCLSDLGDESWCIRHGFTECCHEALVLHACFQNDWVINGCVILLSSTFWLLSPVHSIKKAEKKQKELCLTF